MSDPVVYRVTDARVPLSKDQASRHRRYLISMSIRSTCFVLCILADGWLRWVLFAGAMVLPWIAVVIANAGRESAPCAADEVQRSPWALD